MTNNPKDVPTKTPRIRPPLKLEISPNLEAQYVNFTLITHSRTEMILDFGQVLPNTPRIRIRSRLVLTPTNAKQLLRALEDSVAKYETAYGEIQTPPTLADQLFMRVNNSGTPEAEVDAPEGSPDE